MAYMSQNRKKEIVAAAKPILAKYGIKATFSVRNGSTIVCTLREGRIDFKKDYIAETEPHVNPYHYQNYFTGTAKSFLCDLVPILNKGNWNNSRIEVDYFDVGWYVDVNIGDYKKPYVVKA